MIFKTWLSDINKTAVALDNVQYIRFDSNNIAITKAYTESIRGLNEEQARYVLTKRYVKEADQNDLLIKAGIVIANEGVEATELSRQLVLQGLKKEIAEALIEQEAGNKAISSNTILTKEQTASILKQAEARKLLSAEQSKNIANDIKETKTSVEEAVAEETQTAAKLGSTSSILSRGVSQIGRSILSFFSIFISSPVSVIATITGSVIGLTYAIGKLQDSAKNAADKASEFSSSMSSVNSIYNNESQSVKDIAERYDALRLQLLAAKGNEEETYNIKSKLLELQKQLNEIYGDEYGKVNLVTDAYKDQNSVLEKNAKQKAQNYLNEHTDEIETATKKMTTEYTYELGNFYYGLADANIGNELHDEIKQLAVKSGIEWVDRKGFVFKGTAEEASKGINQFMSDVRELQNSTDGLPDYFSDNFQGFFSDMSKQLGYADEIIEGYQETYETAQMAQIASDSTLSNTYNKAISAVEDYNEAVLKSENPYDDKNVKKAWDNLQVVKQGIQDNEEEWGQYSNIMDNVFSSANDHVYSFYNAIQNDAALNGLANDLKGLTDKDLLSMSDDGVEDSFDKLCGSAKEYGLEVQDVIDLLVELGIVQDNVKSDTFNDKSPISFTDTISQVQSLSTGLEKLGKIYTDVKNKESFDWSSILNNEEFANTFSSMGSTYDNFIKTVSNAPDDIEACQKAFDTLATSYIYNTKDASGNNVMDNLTESTKDATVAMLEQMGVVNALEVVEAELAKKEEILEVQRRYASEHATELIDATYKQANAYITEADCSEISKKYLAQLYLQKNLFNGTEISTADDCENLIQLAKTAGYSTSVITRLEKLKQMFVDNPLMSNVVREDINRAIKNIFSESQADIEGIDFELEFDGSNAETSASSALKSFTDLLDKELDMLDWKMEAGYTDFNDYIHDRLALIEDYYQQGRLSADEYYSYLEQHYDKQLSYMDKAINAVTRRIDKEIDELEAQKDEIEHNYQLQIDYLNEQKTLLEEANKERQRQINLQKAQYELERAKNQRTMLIYSEERGLHYVANDTAMKDAQQEVEDAEFDIQIADIESSISKLEEARDTETAAIDAMIEKLQEYKEQWTDISSAYEEEQENLIAAQIFGQEWESEILDGRLDTLNRFKDNYIAIQQAMADAAYQAAQAIANGEKTTIEDTSKGKTGSSTDEPEHGWEVVDESDPSNSQQFGKTKDQKAKAEAYLRAENKKRAASIGIDVSKDDPNDPNPEWLRLFKNSNVPGFYMKKYHTGLQQGPVKQHSFDEDFKLIRRVGLGAEEVPAILKVGEAVATPEQIHNLADSIRQSAMPNLLISPSSNYPFAQNIDHITSSPTQQVINQNITLNCPNVTNHSGVEYIQRELGHLSLRALQESRKR